MAFGSEMSQFLYNFQIPFLLRSRLVRKKDKRIRLQLQSGKQDRNPIDYWRSSATLPKSGLENDIHQSDSGWEIGKQGEVKTMKTDTELQQDVMNELKCETTIRAGEIGVVVKDGVVTLSGYVDSYVKKLVAERAAARVFGVRAVAEEIQVRLPGSLQRSDEDIAEMVANVLEWNVLVPHDRVKVQVQDGLVTLSGEIDWWYRPLDRCLTQL